MDALSAVLDQIRISSTVYFRSDFSAPWGMQIDKGPFAQFHFVARGQCLLKTDTQEIDLFAGDIVIFPHGDKHALADQKGSVTIEGKKVVQAIMRGGHLFPGERVATTLICGHFQYDKSSPHRLTDELPSLIHIPDKDRRAMPWLSKITDLILEETEGAHEGSEIIVNKLAEVLFVHSIRAFMHMNTPDAGFFAAVKDHRMSKVLKAIHTTPERAWTVLEMAQEAGMSRTAFSNRFKELMRETPMMYLSNWRVTKAKGILAHGSSPIADIAHEVGYRSEAAFIKVFKKSESVTPLKYRQKVS